MHSSLCFVLSSSSSQVLTLARALCLPLQVKLHQSQRTPVVVYFLRLFSSPDVIPVLVKRSPVCSCTDGWLCCIFHHLPRYCIISIPLPRPSRRSFLNNDRLNQNWCFLGLNCVFALQRFRVFPLRVYIFSVLCFPLRKYCSQKK